MMNAVERARQMLYIPASKLPPAALALRDKMWRELGMCIEVCLTAFICYAQVIEGLPCDDELYICQPTERLFLETYNANSGARFNSFRAPRSKMV